jgi:Domain of unknown function (DUF4406)
VSGAITPMGKGNHALEFLSNVKKGIRLTIELLRLGYAVYCPFTDLLYWFCLEGREEIPVEMIYKADLAMLERMDAMLLVPGWEHSTGVEGEVALANSLGIPVFKSVEKLAKAIK